MENPKIRFKGFTKDWEQRKLGDLVNRITRKNQDLVSELPLTISAQYGLIDQNEFFDKRVASKDVSGYYLIENGEFAYNKSTSTDAPWGAIKRLDRYENGVLSTLYIVFGIKENNLVDSDFLVSYYSTNLWHKGIHEIAAEGARNHGLLNIAPADFFETKLMIPQDIEEQKKIGKYFEELDHLITLHQRKCDQTKNLKKYMLQKMFPQNGAKVPEIRFDGYTYDWEQRKLGDIGSTFTGLSGKTKEDFGHGDAQFITYMNVFSNPVANLEMTEAVEIDAKQNCVKKGDVFFTTSSETPEEVGMSCVMPENKDNIYLNSFCFGYRPTEKFDLDYLAYVLRADSFRQEMTFLAQGISRYNISKNKVMEVSIPIPNLEEQTMVGQYFSNLDHLITLHQRKCDQTKNLKKYMLQKMFPQNGAKVPEIRFDGYTYDWEQRKLGDIGSTFTGLSGKTKEDFGHGDAQFITYMNVFSNPVANLEMTEAVEIDAKQNCVKKGDVFFTTSSETPEEVGMSCVMPENKDNIYLNSFCFGYRPTEKFDLDYLAYVLRADSFRQEMTFLAQGISRYNISKNKVMEVSIPIPNLEEQTMVGQYFSNLDHLITLHQRKCDELKKMKKYMLQNMFI